ncbi:STAS/SEC14 domain-containing protein [Mucilaginibacter flavus]|uniref:STAS/SEC14 domain-containing protein n=1 Tax=Mucilaginibacter flavus TaxID=931504 RepID=UPI0025B44571|nr:STAS/SEC14 domain-containing protein [Mucilaginibacter flavus]MDN3579249.1 STAS/SEC14 domain-containing protein [Mucilaginibacter flavus]
MLQHLTYLPKYILGVHAVGEMTNEEYEQQLEPLLDEHIKENGKINYLLILEADIKNFDAGAWCGNIGIGLKYFTKWNKLAIVTDREGVREFSHLFKYILPGQYKGYRLEELDEAVRWITGA